MNANKRTKNNFIIDAVGYLSFWVLVSTGIIMKYVLLPGRARRANDPTSIMSLGRHEWGDIHFWASIIFVGAIVIHLLLHWNWIAGVFQKILRSNSKKVLIPALGLPVLLAFSPLLGTHGFGEDDEHGAPGRVRGAMHQSAGISSTQFAMKTDSCETPDHGKTESPDINGFKIRGRTTLQEIEQGTGVTIQEIAIAMNLPNNISHNERISFLKEKYGLEMDQIREIVKQLAVK